VVTFLRHSVVHIQSTLFYATKTTSVWHVNNQMFKATLNVNQLCFQFVGIVDFGITFYSKCVSVIQGIQFGTPESLI